MLTTLSLLTTDKLYHFITLLLNPIHSSCIDPKIVFGLMKTSSWTSSPLTWHSPNSVCVVFSYEEQSFPLASSVFSMLSLNRTFFETNLQTGRTTKHVVRLVDSLLSSETDLICIKIFFSWFGSATFPLTVCNGALYC